MTNQNFAHVMKLASKYWGKPKYRAKLKHWQICIKYAFQQFEKGIRLERSQTPIYITLDLYGNYDILKIRSKSNKNEHQQKKRNIANFYQSNLMGTRVQRYYNA